MEQSYKEHPREPVDIWRAEHIVMATGSEALHYQNFLELAAQESDPNFAEDLRFSAYIADLTRDSGGLALAVGGYARDLAMGRILNSPQVAKDIDIEVYGIKFTDLVELLRSVGEVNLVGQSFGIAKVKNPMTGRLIDFSIPREDSKVDRGHRGFIVRGDPLMGIAEAARRRDLTINTLALDPLTGQMYDEHGGLQDIHDRILRATDPQLFADDPLRVLRVMQFAGRFEFAVDPATAELCKSLDLTELSRERVGEEWIKLMTKSIRPSIGLEVARQLGILKQLHPELDGLDEIAQEPDWHPEGNVWNHTKHAADASALVVRQEGLKGDDALVVHFGALLHDLGKKTTTALREKRGVMRITAHDHEAAGVDPARNFLKGLRMKNAVILKIMPIIRHHLYHQHHSAASDEQIYKLAIALNPSSIRLWDMVSRCDANGRGGPFQSRTASYRFYERALQLGVSEHPAPYLVQGRDLIERFGMKPGPVFTPILSHLYRMQLRGRFSSTEDGLAYFEKYRNGIPPR